jgi:condensin complex subunit 1
MAALSPNKHELTKADCHQSYTLRCALIEVCGNLIADLSKQDERGDNHLSQINSFFDVLEERFLDVNPYCRCRAMQVFIKLCDLEAKFPKRRQAVAELVVKRLEDKSSNVRKNAIKLLSKLVTSHPFSAMHGGQLSYAEWTARLNAVQTELNQLEASTGALHAVAGEGDSREATVDEDLLDDATDIGNQPQAATQQQNQEASAVANAGVDPATSETLARLQLTQRYYQEAIRFIEVLHQASPLICQLLQSKNKSEVIEAMDYFVIIDAYKVETARAGIRRMLRLVWTKGNSDEGKGVQTHLIECYKGLFFEAPDTFSANDAANYVARSMISLTFGATPAELTSLEQLLCSMMKAGHISELVLSKLWQVYGVRKKEISKNQRRGAIIVLGMLALADPQIVAKELETVVRIGLGGIGRADLVLAKYSCIALARLNTSKRQGKGEAPPSGPWKHIILLAIDLRLSESAPSLARLPNDHVVLVQLAALLGMQSDSKEW